MGTLGLDSSRLGAFQSDTFPRGLDLGRSMITQDPGIWRAADTADFQAGMLVAQDANGDIVKSVGGPSLGVAKWNKTSLWTAAAVDEPLVFAASGAAVSLKKPNVSNFQLRSAVDFGGSQFADPADYALNAANGLVTHNGGGTIPTSTTVYASYTFELSQKDLDFQGRNFFNFQDDVSVADGRVTVITGATLLFTTMYDQSQVYTLTGATKNLYAGGGATAALAGLFTSDAAEGEFVGHVVQVPSADDPFLGVRLGGNPVEI